ncbi:NAD(+) synthase [Candidatus Roizmanbacteria bacterium]|nr:MAG: NAD(+) synthase [Candidatus Roizmanbacteria bacterium]
MNSIPSIQTTSEVALAKAFIQTTLKDTKRENVIIAVSGGIDSATSLYLLNEALDKRNIFVVHLYYFKKSIEAFHAVVDPMKLPKENILLYSIKNVVDAIVQNVSAENDPVRTGNIMARVRMLHLFDLAKKHTALVCGTENRSEYHLGYFTRFGDAASDFELINHLYKTQVRQLASYLQVPQPILDAEPSAGLWEGQTDEKELGFTYEEADQILYLHFEEGKSAVEISEQGFENTDAVLSVVEKNSFKHKVPYVMG